MEKNNVTTPKRLVVDVPDNFHKEVKERATRRNISIKTWIVRALQEKMQEEKSYE